MVCIKIFSWKTLCLSLSWQIKFWVEENTFIISGCPWGSKWVFSKIMIGLCASLMKNFPKGTYYCVGFDEGGFIELCIFWKTTWLYKGSKALYWFFKGRGGHGPISCFVGHGFVYWVAGYPCFYLFLFFGIIIFPVEILVRESLVNSFLLLL